MTHQESDDTRTKDSIEQIEDLEGADRADVEQDAGVGPIEGDEAMDDDAAFRHTPLPPTPR